MPTETYRDESRKNWHNGSTEKASLEEISVGCMQRMADATEAMAKSHTVLIQEKEYYRKRCEQLQKEIATLKKRASTFKGLYHKEKKGLR